MPSNRSALDYASLVKALRGQTGGTVTFNWDVAVTYDANQINARLKAEYEKPGTKIPTRLDLQYKDIGGIDEDEEFIRHFELELGPPCITFNATSSNPTCSLEISLAGKYWNEEVDSGRRGKDQVIEAGAFALLLNNFALATINASDSTVTHSGNVVMFPDNTTEEHIIIDFATDGSLTSVDIISHKYEREKWPPALKNNKLTEAAKDFFKKKGSAIEYTLAIVNNATPRPNEVVLVPQRFLFVCTGTETLSYLTLLIGVEGSSVAGKWDGIQSQWDALWTGELGTYPVPHPQSASIFFGKSFFVKNYLGAAVKSSGGNGFFGVRAIGLPPGQSSGFAVEFSWNYISTSPGHDHHRIDHVGGYDEYDLTVDSRRIDPNAGGQQLTMYFGQANGDYSAPTVDISWSYRDDIPWSDKLTVHDNGPPPFNSTDRGHGKVIGTWSMKKRVSLNVGLDQETLKVSFDIAKSDWSYTSRPESQSWAGVFKSLLPGGSTPSERLPSYVAAMAGEPISFTFDFGLLRFFAITNVLLPGKKVIDIDTSAGLRIPNDVMIVGNVVKDA